MTESEDRTPSQETPVYTPRYRPLWNNFITKGGMIIALLAMLGLLTFGLFSAVSPAANPYVDIIGFLIIPVFLLLGLALMPLGIWFKSWLERRKDPTLALRFRFPRVDLNDPAQRRVAKIVLGITVVALPIIGVSGYHGYHFTDSVEFCGSACHTVMEPQMAAFQRSPHARVACAQCHIGEGAGWFVKAKLSGTRQVLAVMQNSFPRPIPPAITELRPARETCEHCHWPQKFFGSQLREVVHYGSDEKNTAYRVDMLLRTGGGDETFGSSEGIHRHMALEGSVEYIATDEHLQEVPWVKWITESGEELIYRSDRRPTSDPPPEGVTRLVDCMDCHNRAAHKFQTPQLALDVAMFAGHIEPDIPYIKREAARAMLASFDSNGEARARIGEELLAFYETEYPEYLAQNRDDVFRAVDTIRDIFEHSFFPEMNVDWRTYPDNIGHLNSPGCFRCHDGKHVNQYGVTISKECGVCHTFMTPTESGESVLYRRGEFEHPVPLGDGHGEVLCHQCHDGGRAPVSTCEGCHVEQQELYAGLVTYGLELEPYPNYMMDIAGCEDCHDNSQPHSLELVTATCVECHDGDESYAEILDEWLADLDESRAGLVEVMEQAEASGSVEGRDWLAKSRDILGSLDRAGNQHNPDLALEIYELLTDQGEDVLASASAETASR